MKQESVGRKARKSIQIIHVSGDHTTPSDLDGLLFNWSDTMPFNPTVGEELLLGRTVGRKYSKLFPMIGEAATIPEIQSAIHLFKSC